MRAWLAQVRPDFMHSADLLYLRHAPFGSRGMVHMTQAFEKLKMTLEDKGALTDEEIAEALGIDVQEFHNLLLRVSGNSLVSMDENCYCRYCTRRRLVGSSERSITQGNFEEVLKYLKTNSQLDSNRWLIVNGQSFRIGRTSMNYIVIPLLLDFLFHWVHHSSWAYPSSLLATGTTLRFDCSQ
jgi:hypothetical protein